MNEETKRLVDAGQEMLSGWKHFLECIDFNHSYLDADAICWMNEAPGKLAKALKLVNY